MKATVSIVAGLIAGIAVAAVVLGGILVLAPPPTPSATPLPSVELPSPSPDPSARATGTASAPSPSVSPSGSVTPGEALFHIGEPAPALVVPQVGGGMIDLAELKGQPVWVNFMGTYCPPCVDEFPVMNGFATRYGEDGLVVLAIDVREEEGTVAAFANGLNAVFPLGLDPDGSVAESWEADAVLPVHFWVDAEGIIRDGAFGGIGPDIMARGLQTILPGVDVQP
ncbi:MAG TPA: TlpA disulfide reductase family protein [Candidatus Saccharimonadales bacterium]|nr:TlpA disulfide reductase family protein [Candidatus Saccharimonadales bacterium]